MNEYLATLRNFKDGFISLGRIIQKVSSSTEKYYFGTMKVSSNNYSYKERCYAYALKLHHNPMSEKDKESISNQEKMYRKAMYPYFKIIKKSEF